MSPHFENGDSVFFDILPEQALTLVLCRHFFHKFDKGAGGFRKVSIFQVGQNDIAFDMFLQGDGKDIRMLVVFVDFAGIKASPMFVPTRPKTLTLR